ncbi:MAG: hypothetical protein V4681_03040 [Patescibacteria group bacterium]
MINFEFDVSIVIGPRDGKRQQIRIHFSESGLRKLSKRSKAFEEGLRLIEGELAKELSHEEGFTCAGLSFDADDPDLADCEARDIADLFLSRLKLSASIVDMNKMAA